MEDAQTAILAGLIFLAAAVYSSVGHAGASGYIAAMALMGVPPAVMKPTALTLNILAASFGTWRLYRAGLVSVPSALSPQRRVPLDINPVGSLRRHVTR